MVKIVFRILKFLRNGLIAFLSIIILYLAAAIIGSAIPVNTYQTEAGEVTVYLRTNGVHTDFVFPIKNEIMDWNNLSKPTHTLSKRTDFNFVSFGWGDLKFYKETPEWPNLRFPVAFQAVFLRKPSALHVEFLNTLRYEKPLIPVEITARQYKSLVNFVVHSFDYDPSGEVIPVPGLHYNQNDVFYPARRSLHFFYTCNTWVNEGLKKAGLRACLWTPFEEGIFYQYR